jgi:peptidoglycan-associated lipoprotein
MAAVSGCRKTPVNVTNLPGYKPQNVGEGNPGTPINPNDTNIVGFPQNPPGVHENWPEDPKMFDAQTVHFDYDSSVVKSGDKPKVAAVADALKANATAAVRVDGHCDERGTEEYNRSLGERRALAVREALIHDGIDPSRVDTRSYGRDRPVDTGKSEAAHKKNRRGEFILLTPPPPK